MSKRILFISYYFAPQNVIGAVRPTKLAKYLTRMGYEVTVLCAGSLGTLRDPLLAADLAELADVQVVRERSLFRWWKERGQSAEVTRTLTDRPVLPEQGMTEEAMQRSAALAKAQNEADQNVGQSVPKTAQASAAPGARWLNALYLWLFHRGDMAFARACTRKLLAMDRHFDLVFSCYGPLSVHTVARRAKRFRVADRWVADFRDEASVPFRWQKGWLTRYLRRVRKNADAITGVAQGTLRMMNLETFGQIVPNGYDPEDVERLPVFRFSESALSIAYCGQMYPGFSDVTPVFRAARELCDQGVCNPGQFRFHYAGRQGATFLAQAAQYGLEGSVTDHGMLPRADSLALQQAADVLLMATWNTPERQGVVTGKLLEYMMANRPVLCCVSGSVPGSEARALVDRTAIGVGYEQATDAADAPRLREYLLTLCRAKLSHSPLPFAPNREVVEAFSYRTIAASLAEVLENASC
ncbi:MAG TPA: glycosyltransferase [Candidatus Limiplasma sp.]|nr:glycosyltransferase [Candidatus Limiplasma sp.]